MKAVKDRKERYDRGSCVGQFELGNLVWCRIPGMDCKLAEAWSGPWEVVARLNAVNYRVKRLSEKGKQRVVHINTLKACVDREGRVYRLTVVAEVDEDGGAGGMTLSQVCNEYKESDIDVIKEEFEDVLRDEQGNTESAVMELELLDNTPI